MIQMTRAFDGPGRDGHRPVWGDCVTAFTVGDRHGEFCHTDEFGYEANECEAHNTLLCIAVEHGVPIYTGLELEFDEAE